VVSTLKVNITLETQQYPSSLMTNSKSTCLTNTGSEEENSSPFYSYEHDQDPIMIAARSQKNVRWKHYSEDNTPLNHQHFDTIPPLNLIALGRTGDGKSSLLNDLMGHQVFEQKISAKVI
jgi:ABC-type transport system involved in cytochrome bd biosynthesis fused ATPase/permease subunit